ncbi:MAG: S41 family peptidase [bacterium]|jgi:carboxyl-terminal processing protease
MLLAVLPALCLLAAQAEGEPNEVERELKRFIDVYAVVERMSADPVDPERAIYGGAIPGMLRGLDPHSVFFDSHQFEQLRELENSTRKGFGSVVSVMPGRVIVLQALPGTPAAKSGLSPGDEIVAINGYSLATLSLDQLVGLLEQARRQQAHIDVRRPGNSAILRFLLTPEEMQAPSVDRAFMLRPGIAYIRATSFDMETGKQLQDAIENLGGASLRGLVLDLRDNPGGIVGAALHTASLFLRPKQLLITARGRSVPSQEQVVPEGAEPYTFPLAVLINEKSASAAEIVAGALQDHDRAVIVGAPSFGKGLVETVYPLSDGAGLALTTAYYYTPSGRSIQRPLSGGRIDQGAIAGRADEASEYRSDSGRLLRGGGGIQPDREVYPEPLTRFRMVMLGSGVFTTFAADYARSHPAPAGLEITGEMLDEFQVYLSERSIRPGLAEWSREREWIRGRLHVELAMQYYGVERGDQIEAGIDPVVTAAVAALAPEEGAN